mmetsp:Transcript_24837/g.36623  ORF Transcript_24837/g.36623 Transcript_24837/m.36623 type:complete len:184 (+) Transcript_24837:31-582(+)
MMSGHDMEIFDAEMPGGESSEAAIDFEKFNCCKNFQKCCEDFVCDHCGHLEYGNGYTNHCSQCLWSKHVDINPGDRTADCNGLMPPVVIDMKKGNYRFLQRCQICGHERWNKAQQNDSFNMIVLLSSSLSSDPDISVSSKPRSQGHSKKSIRKTNRNGRSTSKGEKKYSLTAGITKTPRRGVW